MTISLLDTGTQEALVFVEETVPDSLGNPVVKPSDEGVAVRGSVQPIRMDSDLAAGQNIEQQYRFRPDRRAVLPIGPWAAIEWLGERFEVLGGPYRQTGSSRTAHTWFRLRRQ